MICYSTALPPLTCPPCLFISVSPAYTFIPLPISACLVPLFMSPLSLFPPCPLSHTFSHILSPLSLSSTSLPSLSSLSSPPPSPFPVTPSSLDLLPSHPALATAALPFSFSTLPLSPYLFLLSSLLSSFLAHLLPPASSPELSFPTLIPPLLLSLQFNFHLFLSSSLFLYLLSLPPYFLSDDLTLLSRPSFSLFTSRSLPLSLLPLPPPWLYLLHPPTFPFFCP
jgi:hypothetical protein